MQNLAGASALPDRICRLSLSVFFDVRGHRLGYGGGYYDRTLATLSVASIGVAYDVLEVLGFEAQAHDRTLDWIVTESRVLAGAAARD